MDDDNLDALMVACVTALSTGEGVGEAEGKQTALGELCRTNIFTDFGTRVPMFVAAKARAEVAVVRASTERAYVQALGSCFEAQARAQGDAAAAAQKNCADLMKVLAGLAASMSVTGPQAAAPETTPPAATPTTIPAATTPARNQ